MENYKQKLVSLMFYGGLTTMVILVGVFLFNDPTLAQEATQTAASSGTGLLIARIFQVILGVALVVSLGFLVYGVFLISSAEGDEIQEARGKRLAQLSGLVFVILAIIFGILTFAISRLKRRASTPVTPAITRDVGRGLGGFPTNLLEAYYPENGQRNLSRNTGIMITFTESMDISTIVNDNGTPDNRDDDTLNTSSIKILPSSGDFETGPFVNAKAQYTDDQMTFLFSPTELLGSSEENTLYTVIIGSAVTSDNGFSSFADLGEFIWEFEVGTFVDSEPPHLVSVFPSEGSVHPKNALVQLTFNEAMNPLTVMGSIARGFDNISIRDNTGELIDGRFVISNQFRTIEFIPDEYCGTNACEEDIYCLPGEQEITVGVRAASVSIQPPAASFPFDGVTDAASNSFDGNIDGSAVGSPDDDYMLTFSTTNQVDKTPPVIVSVTPNPYATSVSLTDPLSATFSKPLQFSSISRRSIRVDGVNDYNLSMSTNNGQSQITINHSGFAQDATYSPGITSDVKDLYQNCYRPCEGP